MACVDDGSNVPTSSLPATSSIFGSPGGSHRSYDAQFKELRVMLLPLVRDSQILITTSRQSVTPWISSLPELPMSNRSSIPSLPRWFRLQRWNRMSAPLHRMSAPSLHTCARLKQMLPLLQAFPAQQDLGPYQDRLMALQPQGPMAQDHLKTTGTQDADMILFVELRC